MAALKIKPLKNHWICVSPAGVPDYQSIASLRVNSQKKCTSGVRTWKRWYEDGWRCIMVNINFEIL